MSDQNMIRAIALASAERLAKDIDPKLPRYTEAALNGMREERRAERFCNPDLMVSIASFLVSAAGPAWQIYSDIKSKSPKQPPAPEVIERKVRLSLEVDGSSLTPEQQKALIETVVAETLKM